MARRLLGAISTLLVILGVLAVVDVKRGPSAGEALAAARRFVADHPRVRLTGALERRSAGVATQGTIDGEIEALYRSRLVTSFDGVSFRETVAYDAMAYTRTSTSVAEFANTRFSTRARGTDADAEPPVEYVLAALLNAAQDPVKTGFDGTTTKIRVDVDPASVAGGDYPRDLTWTLHAWVRKDGEVTRTVSLMRDATSTVTASVRYSDWGDRRIKIARPKRSDISTTPEEWRAAIASWNDAPLFMPRAIPAGWEQTSARIVPAEDTAEGCRQIALDYENPDDAERGYLYLYEFPSTCAQPFAEAGKTTFRAGPYSGFGRASSEQGSLVQITVGTTTVQADSDLSLSALSRVLADLAPLDFTVRLASISV